MLEELGISLGTAIVVLIALYCVIKSAVKNAIEEKCSDIRKAVTQGIGDYYGRNVYTEQDEEEEAIE